MSKPQTNSQRLDEAAKYWHKAAVRARMQNRMLSFTPDQADALGRLLAVSSTGSSAALHMADVTFRSEAS